MYHMLWLLLRILVFLLGATSVLAALLSAIRTFVLPRSASDIFSRNVFIAVRMLFELRKRRADTYERRDQIMELYAPMSLLALLVVWLLCIQLGYTAMFWGLTDGSLYQAFKISGSSLFTLGLAFVDTFPAILLTFTEAAIGLLIVALLIAYLPAIYGSFSRREAAVTLLETRAGSPPSAVEIIKRYHHIGGLGDLTEVWRGWETWFAEIEESHTSLGSLPFFRSPQPQRSWITAAGTILDTASLINAAVDIPHDPQADLCIRAGYICLRYISRFFRMPFDPNLAPIDPISISRVEFDLACDELAADGVPMKRDRDQAWRDFAGWRVNYDTVLLALAELTDAPRAPWTSDRFLIHPPRLLARYRKIKCQGGRLRHFVDGRALLPGSLEPLR
ncbi:hypothetical protein [Ktedonobacter racemifer]|uniref:Ion transport 2 domain protein n=1 Tax=Ktedonobacter racemifer DSM 44963 TaxID=485913 RepID=D6TBD3_KTERA|nr:hypothetical protein [Ktedonobacter racemifer]EFH87917.1 conserved hypothetical protein [Ktedonobacter racemifer DSM 44963]